MTQTVNATRWVVAHCEACNKRRVRPEGRPCGWCESGEERPRGRTLAGRSYLFGFAREVERAGMTIEEVAERAGVDVGWLASIEGGEGTHDVLYSHLGRAGEGPRSRLGRNGGTTAMSTT